MGMKRVAGLASNTIPKKRNGMGTEQAQTAGTASNGLHPFRGQDGQHTLSDSSYEDGSSSEVRFPYNFRLTHSCTRATQNTKAPNSQ